MGEEDEDRSGITLQGRCDAGDLSGRHGGARAALHCGGPAYAAIAVAWGFELVTVGTDMRLLAGAAGAAATQARALIAELWRAADPASRDESRVIK